MAEKYLFAPKYWATQAPVVCFPLLTRLYAMAKGKHLDLGFEQKRMSIYDFRETSRVLKK